MQKYFENPLALAFFVFLVSLPFGTKKFLFEVPTNLPRFQEFSAVFLFLTDMTAVLFLFLFLFSKNIWEDAGTVFAKNKKAQTLLFLFFCFVLVTVWYTPLSFPGLFLYARLFLAVAAGVAAMTLLFKKIISFASVATAIAGTAVLEGLVGIFQSIFQKSVGLWFLGESVITGATKNVGRALVDGGFLLRSYGTFPHANIYAAFLVLGLAALYYLFLSEATKKFSVRRIAIGAGILIVSTGLLFSFSRSGWIGAGIMTFFVVLLGLWIREMRFPVLLLFARIVAIAVFLLAAFGHLVLPRAAIPIQTDPSFQYRVLYNTIGIRTIVERPSGVGLGNQVAYGVGRGFYQDEGITEKEFWNWQPVHNLFILIATEAGFPALAVFLIFLAYLGVAGWITLRQTKGMFPVEIVVMFSLFISFLVMAMADHYFWDLQAGRLMFWLLLGIMMGLSPRRSMDRISPSEGGDGRSNRPEGTSIKEHEES